MWQFFANILSDMLGIGPGLSGSQKSIDSFNQDSDDTYSDDRTDHPYTLNQYVANDGAIGGFFNYIWGAITGRNNANESADMSFKHDEDMLRLQRDIYKEGLVEDPSLSMKGLTDAGINPNAAAQGLSGSSGGYSPSASSNAAPMAQNVIPTLLSTLLNQPLIQAQARNQNAQADKTNEETSWMPRLNQQQIQESQSRIYNTFERLDIDRKYLGLADQMNNSLIGKNEAEVKQITKQCQLLDQDIQKAIQETKLFEKYNQHELIKMSYTKSQKRKTDAETELTRKMGENVVYDNELKQQQIDESKSRVDVNQATAENIGVQTEGQRIQNDINEVERTMQDFRLRCSQILHCDVNASETTMLLEASLNNQAGQVASAVEASHSGFFGTYNRTIKSVLSRDRRSKLSDFLMKN